MKPNIYPPSAFSEYPTGFDPDLKPGDKDTYAKYI